MTNGWVDIKNADVILCMGGNPAENHPCGFKWAIEARKVRNAKLVAVDPRFTRTAAVADLYSPIRAGTDIAYLNGIIRYAIEKERYHADYVKAHTNAGYVIGTNYGVLNIGRRLALAMALAGLGEWLLVGSTIGLIYRSAPGAEARSAKAAKV